MTIATRTLQMLYSAKTVKSEVLNDNLTVRESDIIYLNCSTYGINCSTVYCDLSALKTRQDVGKLAMKLILNATKLKDNFKLLDETKIVKFSTDAYVEIIRPIGFFKRMTNEELSALKTNEITEDVNKVEITHIE
ncbi:hypothetical protein EAG_08889 [Camponotus floridanus]|uniref:Uncharacterized protein n=1 Tax=Camponotus floridanus TaxID=104421 RepID=E1ZWJ8_CAMFO|nr:hypothetical protein EAG_08889 [Camponotus floridanus]